MVIFRIRNQRNGRAFVGAAPEPSVILDQQFPPSLEEDLKEYCFSTQIICEYNNKDTINKKIEKLLEKEINPYNYDPEPEEEAPQIEYIWEQEGAIEQEDIEDSYLG